MILEFSINTYKQYQIPYKIGLTAYLSIKLSCSLLSPGSYLKASLLILEPLEPLSPITRTCLCESPTRHLIPSCCCAIRIIFPIGYKPCLKVVHHTLALMPTIFTHYGSWLVTGLMLAISIVTSVMSIAIGAESIWVTEEINLLEFTITSGELVIWWLLCEFQLFFITEVNGN